MAIGVSILEDSLLGITIAVPFLHYGLAIFSYLRVLNTYSPMMTGEIIAFFLAYAVQYGWGVTYLFIDLYENNSSDRTVGLYIVVYLIVIPLITSLASAIFKYIDDKKFSLMFWV